MNGRIIKYQRGQIIPMTLAFVVVLFIGLWIMYDSGQINIERTRLQNTADNTAYSTSLMLARDMNYMAYTNRAMILNQAAMGQTVGLVSWVTMMEGVADDIDTASSVIALIPFLGVIFEAFALILKTLVQILSVGIHAFGQIMIPVNDGLIMTLSGSQVAFHTMSMAAATQLAAEVAASNDPNVFQLGTIGQVSPLTVASMVASVEKTIGIAPIVRAKGDPCAVATKDDPECQPQKRYSEFASLVLASRDRFTDNRSYNWGFPFTFDWFDFPPIGGYESRKYGGSEFVQGRDADDRWKWEWTAMDTSSLWVRWCWFKIFPPGIKCRWSETVPWGPGAAHALNNPDTDYGYAADAVHSWGGARNNPGSFSRADSINGTNRAGLTLGGVPGGGLRPFYDFNQDGTGYDEGPAVTIIVYKRDEHILTQQTMDETVAEFEAVDELRVETPGQALVQERISAMSKAATYFYRPYGHGFDTARWQRTPGDSWNAPYNNDEPSFEHGNLYSPFWSARLVDTTDVERLAALAAISFIPSTE